MLPESFTPEVRNLIDELQAIKHGEQQAVLYLMEQLTIKLNEQKRVK